MKSILLFLRNRKIIVLLIYWVVLAVIYTLVADDGNATISSNKILFVLALVVTYYMGYLTMQSWKFAIVFPGLLLLIRGGDKALIYSNEYLVSLIIIAVMFFHFIIITKYIKIGHMLNIILGIMTLILFVVSFSIDTNVFYFGLKEALCNANIAVLIAFILFTALTVSRKVTDTKMLLLRFKEYLISFAIYYVFSFLVSRQGQFRYYMSSTIFQVLIIFLMYVFLTMWWHPGYYYEEKIGTHRFDVFADDYRTIHTRNVNKISGEDSDFFTSYKLKEIEKYICHGDMFMDFGCGDGNTAKYFCKLFSDVSYVGIDVSEKSIEKAKKSDILGCNFYFYDGVKIPFDDCYFDIVYMACVLHHIRPEHREGILKECLRILKPGGKMIIFEHNPWNIITCNTVDKCPFDEDAILLSPLDSLLKVIQAGFDKAKINFTIFIPRKGLLKRFVFLEKYLRWCPIGAQYYLVAEKR